MRVLQCPLDNCVNELYICNSDKHCTKDLSAVTIYRSLLLLYWTILSWTPLQATSENREPKILRLHRFETQGQSLALRPLIRHGQCIGQEWPVDLCSSTSENANNSYVSL